MKALLLTLFMATFTPSVAAQELLRPQQAFQARAYFVDAHTVEVRFEIAEGYYLYRDKFGFSTEAKNVRLGKATIPRGEVKDDEFFGRVETFRDQVLIRVPVVGTARPKLLSAGSQGCADIGICYPPMTQILTVEPAPPALKNNQPGFTSSTSFPM